MAEQEADAAERKVAPAPKHAPWRATVRMDGALRELTLTPSGDGKTWSYGTSGQCYARTGAEAVETFARMCNWKVLEIIPPEGETYDAARVPTPLIHELLSGVTEGDWQWFSFGGDPGVHTFRRKDMSYELLATTKHRKNATLMAAAKDLALDLIDARAEVSRLRALVAADDRVDGAHGGRPHRQRDRARPRHGDPVIPADALSAVVAIAAALGHPGATVTRRPLADVLRALGACGESIAWAEGYSAAWTTALAACSERSWLTWLYGRLLARGLVRREPLVIAACLCAREVMHLVPAGEERPLRAIETAEAWCRGEATLDEVRAARRGAWDAAYAAAAAAAAYAAAAADDAADAAYAAADAAYAADDDAAPERILAILRRELGPHLLAGLAGVEVGS